MVIVNTILAIVAVILILSILYLIYKPKLDFTGNRIIIWYNKIDIRSRHLEPYARIPFVIYTKRK